MRGEGKSKGEGKGKSRSSAIPPQRAETARWGGMAKDDNLKQKAKMRGQYWP
jgi:hypothetical protein